MEKVLVTGSGGYIGRHVVKSLLDLGFQVIAIDIQNQGVDERATLINGSIFEDDESIFAKLQEPDTVSYTHLYFRRLILSRSEKNDFESDIPRGSSKWGLQQIFFFLFFLLLSFFLVKTFLLFFFSFQMCIRDSF